MSRTARGRVATRSGFEHMGLRPPAGEAGLWD
jgi:Holliday junction resolvasome RuvABC ATP-dependent DNA helicase subunit